MTLRECINPQGKRTLRARLARDIPWVVAAACLAAALTWRASGQLAATYATGVSVLYFYVLYIGMLYGWRVSGYLYEMTKAVWCAETGRVWIAVDKLHNKVTAWLQ